MKVIFLGTSSGAGKTTVTALYCRYLTKSGTDVAPFKASNLSSTSFVTKDGGEIGVGQAFQARVSGTEPSGDMNPVLLKPSGNGTLRLILNGRFCSEIGAENPMDRAAVMKKVCESFDRLSDEYEAVVCEGSGSPAELNLMDTDIANIGIMRERHVPAVLVGDIERGGVFAALYGTWLLMPEDVRPLLKGFVINRFRGDPEILESAVQTIRDLTGMEFIGTIPYAELEFPEEDSLSEPAASRGGDMCAFIANADELLERAKECGLDLEKIKKISSA